jgi:microcystin-dependent protein
MIVGSRPPATFGLLETQGAVLTITRADFLKTVAATLGAIGADATPWLRPVLGFQDQDVFVGEILLFPFNFPPRGFAFCQGQLLAISQNTALFSLLGTTYGGDGKTNFALPDLRGRVPIDYGQGPGLSDYGIGGTGGVETVALSLSQLPAHAHTLTNTLTATARGTSAAGNQRSPAGAIFAADASGVTAVYSNAAPDANGGAVVLAGSATAANSGSGLPHENRQPYLTLNYCIALQGVFPSRP